MFAQNSSSLSNAGFETPVQSGGGNAYNPTGASWTFSGTGGIQANGSIWGAANAPD